MKTTESITTESIRTTDDCLVGVRAEREVSIPWSACSDRLAKADSVERLVAELSPGGYGIHWPLIDEDLTIGGLLERVLPSGDETDTR